MTRLRLNQVVFDAGTQIRAAIDAHVVSEYAEAMTRGAEFPPIVVFHDGNQHYLADGFHRFLASQRIQRFDIAADVNPGTKDDALWFALGANKTNGKRLTEADKTHAIELAFEAWPERMQHAVADQVGCHPSLVSRVYQKLNGSQTVLTGRALKTHTQREAIRRLVTDGVKAEHIAKQVGVSRSRVSEIRTELGLSRSPDRSKAGVQNRHEQMRTMAAEGYSSHQIAGELGLSEAGCRVTLKKAGIDVPADRVVGHSKRHDANRIVDRIVGDAENLIEGVQLIDFTALDRTRLRGWLGSLQASRDKLGAFIRRLMKEQQNGEAA